MGPDLKCIRLTTSASPRFTPGFQQWTRRTRQPFACFRDHFRSSSKRPRRQPATELLANCNTILLKRSPPFRPLSPRTPGTP